MTNKQLYQSIEAKLPLFYKSWWLDAVCAGAWDVALVAEDGQVLAVWPYQLERKAGFKIIRNPLLTPYLGPLFLLGDAKEDMSKWDTEESLAQSLIAQLPPSDYLQFSTLPAYANFLPFLHQGIQHTNKLTYHIDLQQETEVLLANMQKRRRRYLRNGDPDLQIVDGRPYLDTFFSLHKATYTDKGAHYPYSEKFLRELIARDELAQHACFWALLNTQDQPIAMLWVVWDEHTMYQLLSVYVKQNQHPAAFSMLTWHAILHAKAIGLRTFDFEGSVDAGIEPFFRKFGGQRVPYLYFERKTSWLWQLKRKLLG